MKPILCKIPLILVSLAMLMLFQLSATAQDNASGPAESRPAPQFDHDLHQEALEEPGCGACHHIFDDEKGELVYSEDEESYCSDCHLENAQDDIPALREANHASCTACHRNLKKLKKKAGPTTCGECHKKQS